MRGVDELRGTRVLTVEGRDQRGAEPLRQAPVSPSNRPEVGVHDGRRGGREGGLEPRGGPAVGRRGQPVEHPPSPRVMRQDPMRLPGRTRSELATQCDRPVPAAGTCLERQPTLRKGPQLVVHVQNPRAPGAVPICTAKTIVRVIRPCSARLTCPVPRLALHRWRAPRSRHPPWIPRRRPSLASCPTARPSSLRVLGPRSQPQSARWSGDSGLVQVPAYTCVAVPNAIRSADCRPDWVDVDGLGLPRFTGDGASALLMQDTFGFPVPRRLRRSCPSSETPRTAPTSYSSRLEGLR